ncbi:hypothetical protein PROVALCAL_02008 [Providencia alcalifaciens DSM 30120]|uniref:Uncharacterized protein n=1 Tax=Providencia alcalifaciens DSM 30120 TaxID=520999 RepID=B6XF76_9GAMM|nr:hypothetical protein PROVALCAL_02008 [Providencia alcalifaciens DSM 30120]
MTLEVSLINVKMIKNIYSKNNNVNKNQKNSFKLQNTANEHIEV